MTLENVELVMLSVVLFALLWSSCVPEERPPPTTAPPSGPLPPSIKGYELYSWQVGGGWYLTLITGTDRLKTYEEVTMGQARVTEDWVELTLRGIDGLEATLAQLPPGTQVTWLGPRALRQRGVRPGKLALPPRSVLDEVRSACAQAGVDLEVSR
jgi:hypothetical protein